MKARLLDMVKVILGIDGMSCGMCEAHINETIRRSFQVKSVKSSHRKKCTEILSEQEIDEQKLREAIHATGYTVTSYHSEIYTPKRWFC